MNAIKSIRTTINGIEEIYLFFEIDEKIVGVLRGEMRSVPFFKIHRIFVEKLHRKRKIGAQLIEAAEKIAKESGRCIMNGTVSKESQELLKFYYLKGFKKAYLHDCGAVEIVKYI